MKISDQANADWRQQSYLGLLEAQRLGWIRSIGVSNYTIAHLSELLQLNSNAPAVLQIEIHPACPVERDLQELCFHHKIVLQAYSILGTGQLLQNAAVQAMANRLAIAPAQVLIQWVLKQKYALVFKSSKPERVKSNLSRIKEELNDAVTHVIYMINFEYKQRSSKGYLISLRKKSIVGIPLKWPNSTFNT